MLFFGAIDFYLYRAVKFLARNQSSAVRSRWLVVHVSFSLLFLLSLVLIFVVSTNLPYDPSRRWTLVILSLVQGLYISKLVAVLFFVIDDIRRLLLKVKGRIMRQKKKSQQNSPESPTPYRVLPFFRGWALQLDSCCLDHS